MQEKETEILVLVERCKEGERKAQEQLYRQLYDFSMSIAIRYSRDEADAAYILSHAFYKIFRSIKGFDKSKGDLHGWVKRIIISEAIDDIKCRYEFREIKTEVQKVPLLLNVSHCRSVEMMQVFAAVGVLPQPIKEPMKKNSTPPSLFVFTNAS